MNTPITRRIVRTRATIVASFMTALTAGALLTACSSSSNSGSSSSAAPAAGGGQGGTVVETHDGPLGTYLADGSGRSLYMFASDTAKSSSCSGDCATFWPPLIANGTPSASGDVQTAMLSTITRGDGTKQVAYAGHPLYYFKMDSKPGDTNGEGSTGFGAKWWLLAPSGQLITGASAPAGSSAPASSGGGGGYGY